MCGGFFVWVEFYKEYCCLMNIYRRIPNVNLRRTNGISEYTFVYWHILPTLPAKREGNWR
jgi:hypothetical protein